MLANWLTRIKSKHPVFTPRSPCQQSRKETINKIEGLSALNAPLQVKRMSASYSTTAVKCRWRFDCLWSGICSRLRAGQTNLSKTLTSELLPEVPLSGDQANDMLNLSVQNKQKSVHTPWGGHLKAQGFLCWVRWRPCLCTWRLSNIWGEWWDPITSRLSPSQWGGESYPNFKIHLF